jgi:hypothetical protein
MWPLGLERKNRQETGRKKRVGKCGNIQIYFGHLFSSMERLSCLPQSHGTSNYPSTAVSSNNKYSSQSEVKVLCWVLLQAMGIKTNHVRKA